MRAQRSRTRQVHPPDETTVATWASLGIVTLVAMPIAGMLAALITFDVTRSFDAHIAVGAVLPAAGVTVVARRLGTSSWVVLRLALLAALFALVLLNLAWSSAAG